MNGYTIVRSDADPFLSGPCSGPQCEICGERCPAVHIHIYDQRAGDRAVGFVCSEGCAIKATEEYESNLRDAVTGELVTAKKVTG